MVIQSLIRMLTTSSGVETVLAEIIWEHATTHRGFSSYSPPYPPIVSTTRNRALHPGNRAEGERVLRIEVTEYQPFTARRPPTRRPGETVRDGAAPMEVSEQESVLRPARPDVIRAG